MDASMQLDLLVDLLAEQCSSWLSSEKLEIQIFKVQLAITTDNSWLKISLQW